MVDICSLCAFFLGCFCLSCGGYAQVQHVQTEVRRGETLLVSRKNSEEKVVLMILLF